MRAEQRASKSQEVRMRTARRHSCIEGTETRSEAVRWNGPWQMVFPGASFAVAQAFRQRVAAEAVGFVYSSESDQAFAPTFQRPAIYPTPQSPACPTHTESLTHRSHRLVVPRPSSCAQQVLARGS